MEGKLIFSPLKLVFLIALCFYTYFMPSSLYDMDVQYKEVFNIHQQALFFILLPFCNLKCNLLFFAPCSVHFEIFLLATQILVFQNINPLSRRSINHHPAAKVNANNIQIYSTLKTMVLATPADAIFIISDLIHLYIFSRNFKEHFTLFGFDLHVLA